MLLDHEAPGNPIEATLSGLLCVRHSVSHFVSTDGKIVVKYVGAQKRKEIMRSVWVPKFYVTNSLGPKSVWVPKTRA